jgi:Holliday junction resolvasome RuvABC DNA-binding subunit
MSRHPANDDLSARLERIAELLEGQHATAFRVAAYRRAASTVADLPRPTADIFEDGGIDALEALPGIGASIASLIREYLRSGRISLLERLTGAVAAEDVLSTIPGLGARLAQRIHEELGVDTLEELECACADGRLAALPGFGQRRVEAISASLAARLGRRSQTRSRPSVAALLSVDREYRERAGRDELPRIAPRRFNPSGRAWLPILHTARDGWEMTALFSNTARAHHYGRTDDWLVIYSDREGEHDQCTVVTNRSGARTIRGREVEVQDLI